MLSNDSCVLFVGVGVLVHVCMDVTCMCALRAKENSSVQQLNCGMRYRLTFVKQKH